MKFIMKIKFNFKIDFNIDTLKCFADWFLPEGSRILEEFNGCKSRIEPIMYCHWYLAVP